MATSFDFPFLNNVPLYTSANSPPPRSLPMVSCFWSSSNATSCTASSTSLYVVGSTYSLPALRKRPGSFTGKINNRYTEKSNTENEKTSEKHSRKDIELPSSSSSRKYTYIIYSRVQDPINNNTIIYGRDNIRKR